MPNQAAPKPIRANRLYETDSCFLHIPGSKLPGYDHSVPQGQRLFFAGWFLCFLGPRILERDRPVESEVLRRAVFVEDEVAEAFKLIPGFASRLPQAWLAFGRNDFK